MNALLELRSIANIRGRFVVPSYQRGYRWGELEVRQLLNDIYEARSERYCLQPVVVSRRADQSFELIDGQQRLTTLYLFYSFIQRSGLFPTASPPYSISYETRDRSGSYLESLDPKRADENIDFQHMFGAYKAIENWFPSDSNERQERAMTLFLALSRTVEVVWYEVPANDRDEITKMFTRLNAGRIALTDAELFKALLLSSRAGWEADGSGVRPSELVMQWDAIERDLRHPEVWAFVSGEPGEQQPTRILLLLEAIVRNRTGQRHGDLREGYRIFEALRRLVEEHGAKSVWEEVLELHALVMGWYENRELYHRIGWLVASGEPFGAIVQGARGLTRSAFRGQLSSLITKRLGLKRAEIEEISYLTDAASAERLLLLMNIESILSHPASDERYSFDRHHGRHWSLEHIHAQNSEALRTEDEWREYLRLATREVEDDVPAGRAQRETREALLADLENVRASSLDRPLFDAMSTRITQYFSPPDEDHQDIHGMDNLALLAKEDNAALSNSVFAAKRRRVLELGYEGRFVPPCTRHVFLKAFPNSDIRQLHMWSTQDRLAYRSAMLKAVDPYFIRNEAAQNG